MGVLDRVLRRNRNEHLTREVVALNEQLNVERNNGSLLQESLAELERHLSEPGWVRFANLTELEFSSEGMAQMRSICRLLSLSNPLIKRGVALRSAYVWGSGVEITARANGRNSPGEQDVQAVVNAFLTEPSNERAVTGSSARSRLERALATDGDLFIAMFTRPTTGQVRVRVIAADEITEVITNPDDSSEPWYYRRVWMTNNLDPATGMVHQARTERLYPAIDYRPRVKPTTFGNISVAWDTPLLHVEVNRPQGWQRGVPDTYAAIPWARAYKEFLESWAGLMHSLARFAWRLTAKGSTKAQAAARLAQSPTRDPGTGRSLDVGATAITPMDATLEAIPKSGATIDADSGRPLAAMVAAALGVPVTMLLGDPGVTGARATAETLDQPTELEMQQRRDMWAAVYQRMLRYVITESVRAPQGPLRGVITYDAWARQETVALAGDTDTTIDIDWPDLDETPVNVIVTAIKTAADTGVVPPEQILRLLLTALGVRGVDTIVEAMVVDGAFQWPTGPPIGGGQAQADTQRAGGDPAVDGAGPMAPTDPTAPNDSSSGSNQNPEG